MEEMALKMFRRFLCPLCGDEDIFQKHMLLNGTFIPSHTTNDLNIAFHPTSSTTDNDVATTTGWPKQKTRRIHETWLYDKAFENSTEAEGAVALRWKVQRGKTRILPLQIGEIPCSWSERCSDLFFGRFEKQQSVTFSCAVGAISCR